MSVRSSHPLQYVWQYFKSDSDLGAILTQRPSICSLFVYLSSCLPRWRGMHGVRGVCCVAGRQWQR